MNIITVVRTDTRKSARLYTKYIWDYKKRAKVVK